MIKKKSIIYLILCIITLLQLYLYFKKDTETIEVMAINEGKIKENFSQIDRELKEIKKLEILELKDNGYEWSGKVLLSGSKKEILDNIELLDSFNIIKYKIDGNADHFKVLLEIYR